MGDNRVVTVFGGSGFVGRHLIGRLARTGATIRVACRHPLRAGFLKTSGESGQIVPVAVDILSDQEVATAVAGADAVVNLIGILHESGRWTFSAVHAQAAGRIAWAARAAGVGRLVQISAIGADPASASAYARTKGEGEQAVRGAFHEATILRPSIVFGPEDDFFNRFATLTRFSPILPLIGGGFSRFQPVYVGDVAAAILAALESPAALGQTYELGGPRILSFRELMELLLVEIQRHRELVTIPWCLAGIQAAILEKLPNPMLTRDQLVLLRSDNVVATGALTLADLGLTPTPLESILPSYLSRFRPGGGHRSQPNGGGGAGT